MNKHLFAPLLVLLVSLAWLGCQPSPATSTSSPGGPAPVLVSVVSDMTSNPQAVDMAMKFAGFALDENRPVFMFFNVKGVNVPSQATADDATFQENDAVKTQLAKLIERGAKVHVCPICMKALSVKDTDLMQGAQVTNRGALFGAIERGTCVFTY